MLSLSQTTGYAIQALGCLDPAGKQLVLARTIAEQTSIPKPYLSKILHWLRKSGLIVAKRGYRGGVALSRPANTISLLEVAEAVKGDEWRPRCLLGLSVCTDERTCPVHAFWTVERDKIEAQLRNVTLAEATAFEQAWAEVRPRSAPKRRKAAKPRRKRV